MVREQVQRRKKFIENTFWGTMLALTTLAALKFFMWFYEFGREAGKW